MAFAASYVLCFLLLLLMLLNLTNAQTQTNISLGSSLTALNNNLAWISLSGDFAFGFHQIEKDGFLLAIWFNKIPEKTIIWSANRDNLVQTGSKVSLTEVGIFLKDPAGEEIWTRQRTISSAVAYAAMINTGNFVLVDQNLANLWESFSEPTDTLLPTQFLPQGRKLVASYSKANYSRGRFFLTMQTDGNLALYTRKLPLDATNAGYWNSETLFEGRGLRFNQSGFIYVEAENGTVVKILSSNASSTIDFYHRATLEFDGVFVHYLRPKNSSYTSSAWKMIWDSTISIPPNICTSLTEESTGSGACGFNSYCSLGNDQRPNCLCPNGYTFIDPNNEMKGCRQISEAQSCNGDSNDAENFYFDTIESMDFPDSDYENFSPVNEDQCRKACLGDCLCVVGIFQGSNCWMLNNPLRNGRVVNTSDLKALIKLRKDYTNKKPKKKHISTAVLIGIFVISGLVFFLSVATFLVLLHFKLGTKVSGSQQTQSMPGMNLQTFTYEELEKATDGFKEQLGRGAFGIVFKGVLSFDNGNLVAVKKLDNMMKEGEEEFKAEVGAIGRTNHKNLVRLIGFCNELQHRLLVYEFMSNGSLASFIFGPSRPNWHQRTQIALEIARGLVYLHEECSTQIIHCDIKPQNILLDDYFTARISDFGLAKILKIDQTRTTTGIRGTKGYVAPEWFKNMPVTVKVDVYSYGILLLELVCCRKSFEAEAKDETQMVLADWAYDCYKDEKLYLLMENDEEARSDMKRVENYVMVSIWCIQENPSMRPTMKKVIQMLEGSIDIPIPPDPSSMLSS